MTGASYILLVLIMLIALALLPVIADKLPRRFRPANTLRQNVNETEDLTAFSRMGGVDGEQPPIGSNSTPPPSHHDIRKSRRQG